ncbi:MAG: type 4a pilus biogenesis protein PilO [Acidobacteriota bacterium]
MLVAVDGFAQQPAKKANKPVAKNTPKSTAKSSTDTAAREQLAEIKNEIGALLKRVLKNEDEIQQALGDIKNELRLRELRWRVFERSAGVADEPFVFHPVRVELLGTYERLTDALLNLAAFNYLVIVDDLEVKRTRQPSPLVSLEASFTLLLYSLDEQSCAQMQSPTGADIGAQLETAQQSLAQLGARFEERVSCWSALRTLGRRFPKSLESVLTGLSYQRGQLKFNGISRSINTANQLAGGLTESQLFSDVADEQSGPAFKLTARLVTEKAYTQWLEGADNSDLEALARDPFTTSYSLEQLTQGSGASANYPPLEKRLNDYLQQVNTVTTKRLDRTMPYLVAELSLAGVYFTTNQQGAIFKTPNQKEIFVNAGARCYNGRFTGIQQGRALFEEAITNTEGKIQTSQVVKTIESNCFVVTMLPPSKTSQATTQLETAARSKLPDFTVTVNSANVELHSLLPLLHELSGQQFGFVLDQSVPRLCVTISRDRAPFGDVVLYLLQSANLTLVEENGIFRILARDQIADVQAPALAVSVNAPPPTGKFGSADFSAEAITLSLVEAELDDVAKFLSSKYGVGFVLSEKAKKMKVTASVTEKAWPQVLTAMLRAARLGLFIDAERVLVLDRTELQQLQSQGKAVFK